MVFIVNRRENKCAVYFMLSPGTYFSVFITQCFFYCDCVLNRKRDDVQ